MILNSEASKGFMAQAKRSVEQDEVAKGKPASFVVASQIGSLFLRVEAPDKRSAGSDCSCSMLPAMLLTSVSKMTLIPCRLRTAYAIVPSGGWERKQRRIQKRLQSVQQELQAVQGALEALDTAAPDGMTIYESPEVCSL